MVKFLVTICLMLLLGVSPVLAMPEIMTTDQIRPGMQGYAETMIQGNQKVDFNVEIMGVVNNGNGSSKQILAKASGALINDTNGVIHGMSGSPVYVNGKLIGAVARSVGQDVLPYKFYITPIEEMLKIWQLPDPLSTINKSGVKSVNVPTADEYKEKQESFDEDIDKEIEKYKSKVLATPEGEDREKGKAQTRLEEILRDFDGDKTDTEKADLNEETSEVKSSEKQSENTSDKTSEKINENKSEDKNADVKESDIKNEEEKAVENTDKVEKDAETEKSLEDGNKEENKSVETKKEDNAEIKEDSADKEVKETVEDKKTEKTTDETEKDTVKKDDKTEKSSEDEDKIVEVKKDDDEKVKEDNTKDEVKEDKKEDKAKEEAEAAENERFLKALARVNAAGAEKKLNEEISITQFILDSIAKQREINKSSYSMPIDVYVSGFTGNSFEVLKQNLANDNMIPYQGVVFSSDAIGSLNTDIRENASLSAGDAIGVVMVYGDFFAGGTGTVTMVDGDKILAFGHPMTYKGNVNYFLTDADVIGTAGGILNGVKVSSFGKIIGRVNQDRFSGISGILNVYPASVPVRVFVKDKNLGREEEYVAKIAYDEDIIPALASSIAYASMERTADRSSYGTAKVKFTIKTDELPEGEFTRENMFYDAKDVGQFAIGELTQAMYFLCTNMEKPSNIFDVKVDIEYTSNRNTASIVSAIPSKDKVKPGETITFKVMIKPYRKETEIIEIPYVIPKTQKKGTMAFEVKGGGFVQLAEVLQSGLAINPQDAGQMSTVDRLNDLKNLNKNNEIVITPTVDIKSEQDQSKAIADAIKLSEQISKMSKKEREELNKNRETKMETKYVIDNYVQTSVEVEE